MSADGSAPTTPVTLTIRVSADGLARLEAAARAAGQTVEQLAGIALRNELERREAVLAFARVTGIELEQQAKLMPVTRANATHLGLTLSSGALESAPTLPDLPDLLDP